MDVRRQGIVEPEVLLNPRVRHLGNSIFVFSFLFNLFKLCSRANPSRLMILPLHLSRGSVLDGFGLCLHVNLHQSAGS